MMCDICYKEESPLFLVNGLFLCRVCKEKEEHERKKREKET